MTTTPLVTNSSPAVGGVQTVRRVIMYILLITMVCIAASGLSGLLERLFTASRVTVNYDNFGLAFALASALIAGPLAAVLWWLIWRDSASAKDRASVAWAVYLIIMSTVAFLVFTIALFLWAADAIAGHAEPTGLAVGIVWGLVWLWHFWMWHHPRKGPTRLPVAAPAIASLISLAFAAGGLVWVLAGLIDAIIDTLSSAIVVGSPIGVTVAQSLVWVIGGGLLWWWHWFAMGLRSRDTGFANVLLVFITGFASLALLAWGLTFTLSVILRLVTDPSAHLAATLDPLGFAVASALVGALVLVFHLRVVASRATGVRTAHHLVSSGVSLVYAASGLGITVNALLAASTTSLIDGEIRPLLLNGISAMIVGGVIWWLTWRPLAASQPERVATPGRRIYLIIIFGLSAIVALITLLVIGFQLFSMMLDGGGTFLERSRQAIGLLTATVLVATYHFVIWRRDRASDVVHETSRRIERITLVTHSAGRELVDAVRASTGARVSVLQREEAARAAGGAQSNGAAQGEQEAAALAATVVAALDGVEAGHLLVVVGEKSRVEVIRLVN
ncbi:MAG: DUF5671 domain-containing protein [Terrimesophilobacter sp.]